MMMVAVMRLFLVVALVVTVVQAVEDGAAKETLMAALGDIIGEMDDDNDGVVDVNESKDFFVHIDDESEVDLHSDDFYDARSSAFNTHDSGDDDSAVGVAELFQAWSSNEASKWSAPEVQAWVVSKVGLIEAAHKFAVRRIKGADLPLLLAKALHSPSYLEKDFDIRDRNKRAKLLTELSLLVLASKEDNGYANFLKAALGIMAPLVAGVAVYANIVRERQRVMTAKIEKLVSEQDGTLRNLEKKLKDEQTKASRLAEAVDTTKGLSSDVVEILQGWKDEDELALLDLLEEAKANRERHRLKLLKNNKRSLFSPQTFKSHLTGDENAIRANFEAAASAVSQKLQDMDEFEKKWQTLEEAGGVRFQSSSASLILPQTMVPPVAPDHFACDSKKPPQDQSLLSKDKKKKRFSRSSKKDKDKEKEKDKKDKSDWNVVTMTDRDYSSGEITE